MNEERTTAEEKKAKEDKAKKKAEKSREKMKKKQKDDERKEEHPPDKADAKKPSEATKPLAPTALGEELEDIFDISKEIELLKEIKDVRDELNILRNLFDQQKRVLESFCPAIEMCQKDAGLPIPRPTSSLMEAIQRHIDLVASMDEEAKRLYKAVKSLPLQLKCAY